MKHIVYEGYYGPRMPRSVLSNRVHSVMQRELTERQRYAVEQYYLENKTLAQIAAECGVNKSTVCRTLQRAEKRLRRYLRY